LSGAPVRDDTPERPEPHLRLVTDLADGRQQVAPHEQELAWTGASDNHTPHVLVAGADADTRARMLAELRDLLPAGTRFAQASETWEVIACAPTSSMVVLAGDLGEVSGGAVMRLLGRRYPTLPVLAVAEKHTAADVDVAHA
jgi:hypothetical protein